VKKIKNKNRAPQDRDGCMLSPRFSLAAKQQEIKIFKNLK